MNKQSILALLLIFSSLSNAEATELHRGVYTWGAEVEIFSPCRSSKAWWVKADETILMPLRDAHNQLARFPYQGIYVEFEGEFVDFSPEDDGFSLQYEGVFNLLAVRSIALEDCRS